MPFGPPGSNAARSPRGECADANARADPILPQLKHWDAAPRGAASHMRGSEDAAVVERGRDRVRRRLTVQGLRRGDDVARERRHRAAVEAELALEDRGVGLHVADRVADAPERLRPDLAVGVHLADQIGGVRLVLVEAPEAVRLGRRVRRRVPVRDTRGIGRRAADDLGHGHGPVVAEALADRAGLLGRELEALREVDRVAVLVEDHLGVLGVVDAALAEADLVLLVGRERVVHSPLVDPDGLRAHVHRPERRAEAERLDVLLRLGDPVVRHHLLELVLVPVVQEGVRRRVRRGPGRAADHGPSSAQGLGAVEVGQRHRVVGGLGHRTCGVLLVGERLDAEVLHRIRREDQGRTGARTRAGLGGVRGGRSHERQSGHGDKNSLHVSSPLSIATTHSTPAGAASASLRYSGRMTVGPTPSPTVRHLLRDDLRGMYPGYFALVMATGILSNAFFYLGHDTLSDALYGVALVAFPALVAAAVLRVLAFPGAVWADLVDPR